MGHSHLSRLPLRRRLTALALGAAFAALGVQSQSFARPLETVRKAGVLRVAVYQDYKPYSWSQNGQVIGIDVEIAEAFAKSLNVRLDIFELRADDDINDDTYRYANSVRALSSRSDKLLEAVCRCDGWHLD